MSVLKIIRFALSSPKMGHFQPQMTFLTRKNYPTG